MKQLKLRLLILLLFYVLPVLVYAQTDFIYAPNGEKIKFKLRKDKIFLKIKSATEAYTLFEKDSLEIIPSTNIQFAIVSIDTLNIKLQDIKQKQQILGATYMLEYIDGTLQAPTETIFVKCKKGISVEQIIDKLELSQNIKSKQLINPEQEIYSIDLNVSLENIMDIVVNLYETGLCEFAEPSFTRIIKPYNTYYSSQWGLNNTGQNGGSVRCDINAQSAWTISKGANIKVAVLDEGVEITHLDLAANISNFRYDAITMTSGGTSGTPKAGDKHGTNCAGIIGAIDNNFGIVGVAPECEIVPIKIAYYSVVNRGWVTNDSWFVRGINYAWYTAKADVLSNSWGGGSPSTTVTFELLDASSRGRNNKGSVVVFSTGNDGNSSVSYPASIMGVLAVGAVDRNYRRANFSNYGDFLDVVAPGVDIYTTNLNNQYHSSFSGTSAAAPFVSGIAALMLSSAPNLTEVQVRRIICETARRVGNYSYGYWNYMFWNEEMGYGLVDAYEAVKMAQNYCPEINLTGTIPTQTQKAKGTIQNATIPTGNKLTIERCGDIIINPNFEVHGELEIK